MLQITAGIGTPTAVGGAASQQAGSAATARRSPGLRERAPLAAAGGFLVALAASGSHH